MTTPIMVETVRPMPLIVENALPMEAEPCESGFPFDREDRDDHFRSQLDDIAKRHPEFAEHLEGFPFRSDSLGRRRPPRPSEPEFRRFERPFGSSRFERFGFPFEEEQPQPQTPPPPQPQPQEEEEKAKPERGRKQNIQQSNTVDLGQRQEPVNERNQRSMSAPPPDNRPRYVSSINIPINRDGGMGEMGKTQSQPQPPQPEKPVERVIPIHVEGRDEPVMPRNAGPAFQPQPERIFGHRPSQFTQFVPPRHQTPPPPPQQPQPQPTKFQPTKQPQEQVPSPPPPPPQQHGPNPIDTIQLIQKDVSELMGQVEKFSGIPRDKQYLYLDEMLTRNLIKLDNIDTQGQENIRQARKEAIKCIERCIGILEAKAAANVPKQAQTQEEVKEVVETKSEESQPAAEEKMEVEMKESEAEAAPAESENKDEEMKEVLPLPPPPEPVAAEESKEEVASEESKKEEEAGKETSQDENKDDTSDDKKEKKKGKKKVVQK